MKESLEKRRTMKLKKPQFRKDRSQNKKEISRVSWRKPRGQQSKQRTQQKGHSPIVKAGYRGPRIVRSLTREGAQAITITNTTDLEKLIALTKQKNTEHTYVAVIARSIGARKRAQLIQELQKHNISTHNIKNQTNYLETIKQALEKRKQKKKRREEKKTQEKKKKEEKKTETTTKENSTTKETTPQELDSDKEKKELDKLLTKRS